MLLVGLTGGIGSGKSTVAALLAERGAVVVDADAVARDVVTPGSEGLAEVVAAFGGSVLAPDGTLDRTVLAALVFADEAARRRLEAIVHPRVAAVIAARIAHLAADPALPPDAVVVVDHPLIVETGQQGRFDAVVVVEADPEDRVARVVRARGLVPEQVRARMATQASDAERREHATDVLTNDGDLVALEEAVGALHARLAERARSAPRPSPSGASSASGGATP